MAKREPTADWASHEARIRRVLERYSKTRSDWLKNILLRAYTPLVDRIIRGRFRDLVPYHGLEDLHQIGLIGLWRALERHDPQKGLFEAYARRYIAGSILTHVIQEKSVYTISFETKIRDGKRSGEPATLLDFLTSQQDPRDWEETESPDNDQWLKVAQVRLYKLLEYLPELERYIVELVFFGELTPSEIAPLVGLSPQEVGTVRHRAVNKMREYLLSDAEGSQTKEDNQGVSKGPQEREYNTSLVKAYRRRKEEIKTRLGLEKLPKNMPFDRLGTFEGLINASRDGRLDDLLRIHPKAHEAIIYRFGLDDGLYRYRRLLGVGKLMGGITRQRAQQLEVEALTILGIGFRDVKPRQHG